MADFCATLETIEGRYHCFRFASKAERRAWLAHLRDRDYEIFMPRVADRLRTEIREAPAA